MSVLDMAKAVGTPKARQRFIEVGSSGLKQWGGYVESEFLRELQGKKGVDTYREMASNDAVVGAGLFAYVNLGRDVPFRVDSADPGNPQADEVADFVSSALFDDMSLSWHDLISEILTFLTYGWSYFEVIYKQRLGPTQSDASRRSRFDDGKIGWRKWGIRAQDSLERWEFDDSGGVQAMFQRAVPDFTLTRIPIEKSLLFRTRVAGGSPEGVSLLRNAYVSWYFKRRLQIIRGIGIERDLAGLPVITPPEGVDVWNTKDSNLVTLKTNAERLIRNIRRDENEGVLKPHGWTLELLSSSGSRQFDITAVIAQLNTEIAMSMMTDFLLVGHETTGARAVRSEARVTFAGAASAFLDNIADVINRFAIPKLVALNGWHPDLAPTLSHGPVSEVDLKDLAEFMSKTGALGHISPDDSLEDYLRERAQLPPRETDDIQPDVVAPHSEPTPSEADAIANS